MVQPSLSNEGWGPGSCRPQRPGGRPVDRGRRDVVEGVGQDIPGDVGHDFGDLAVGVPGLLDLGQLLVGDVAMPIAGRSTESGRWTRNPIESARMLPFRGFFVV